MDVVRSLSCRSPQSVCAVEYSLLLDVETLRAVSAIENHLHEGRSLVASCDDGDDGIAVSCPSDGARHSRAGGGDLHVALLHGRRSGGGGRSCGRINSVEGVIGLVVAGQSPPRGGRAAGLGLQIESTARAQVGRDGLGHSYGTRGCRVLGTDNITSELGSHVGQHVCFSTALIPKG